MISGQKLDYIAPRVLMRVLRKIRRISAQLFHKTPLKIPSSFRAVSFCFDDFPRSALHGAEILESHGARGVFYTCFSLLGQDSISGKLAELSDVLDLAGRGHEIGCHTYDHIDCAMTPSSAVRRSCQLNREAAEQNGLKLQSFSFPEGEMSLSAKRIMREEYSSSRSVLRGLNQGWGDAHFLKAVPLYETDPETILAFLAQVEHQGGWLIFVTHDISASPFQYGTHVDFFRHIVEQCQKRGLPILKVTEGLKRLRTEC